MDWEDYEKILMQRPGFKEAIEETRFEYEITRLITRRLIARRLIARRLIARRNTKLSR